MRHYKYKMTAAGMLAAAFLTLGGCAGAVEDGAELLEAGDYAGAMEKFQASVEKGKDLAEAYRGIGICYWEEEAYADAEDAFEKALDNGTEATAELYHMMGICEMKAGSATKAAYYFMNGQKKEGASPELMQEMAFNEIAALEAAGDFSSAKYKLESYVAAYPEDEKAAKELEFLRTQTSE